MRLKLTYLKSLDGVRCFAIIIVLLFHCFYGTLKGGWLGVDLFFVLSGYLITSLLEIEIANTKKLSFKKFYIRRLLRLLPPLLVCILLANILWSYTNPGNPNRYLASLAAFFYFANLTPDVLGSLSHLWSLSVEEHFYFIWPALIFYLISKLKFSHRIYFILLLIVLVSALRLFLFNYDGVISYGIFRIDTYRFTFTRIDCMLIGAVLAYCQLNGVSFFNNSKLNYKALLLLVMMLFTVLLFTLDKDSRLFNNGGFLFTNLLCGLFVLAAINLPEYGLLTNKVARWVGMRSYGIYIYHPPIFFFFERFRENHSVANLLLITLIRIAVTLLLVEASYRFIEMPVLKLKSRFK
ncbi:acyltransferase [Mucilaginibacter sp. PAMB04168]|uniref:acyltransferase family protein n=1 Tax=Mucilaginibacter sp. PAMB04168 TaxID=3138567 RepID=UPI0031F6008C